MEKWKRFNYTKEKLQEAVNNSRSINQMILYLGLKVNSSRYSTIKKKLEEFEIDYSHFEGQSWKGTRNNYTKEKFIEKVLCIDGSGWTSHSIKLKLYEFNLKEEKCEKCNLTEWMNNPISLHLDHINGNNKDNRLENLRILCPNCHSQTDTYAGKNINKQQ